MRRPGGTVGLVLNSTVSEGDSREVGTEQLLASGFTIYAARPRFTWPGAASVETVMLWFTGPGYQGVRLLGGTEVPAIYSDLTTRAALSEPVKLVSNHSFICKGHELQGNGFKVTEDAMALILEDRPDEREAFRPLILGEDLNEMPRLSPTCYVINFSMMELSEARRFPAAFSIVESEVKPERDRYTGNTGRDRYLRTNWWRFRGYRKELAQFALTHRRFLACTVHTKYLSFTFLPATWIATPSIYCILRDRFADFAMLQSSPHLAWASAHGSTLGETLRYVAGRCFNTFPFVESALEDGELESRGKAYYEHRAAMMARGGEGLTGTYNRFHDPHERDREIGELRRLHSEMDRAVLHAYGWDDIPTACDFIPENEADEAESARRHKPWRYRWPDDVRDEVLARLVKLNAERAAAERRSGAAPATGRGGARARARTATAAQSEGLF